MVRCARFISVVPELAFLSLVKPCPAAGLSRLEESLRRQIPVRSCRFSFQRPERCAHTSCPNQKDEAAKHLQHIHPHAPGVYVGSRSHFLAVPKGRYQVVQEFTSFTDDLYRMTDWLIHCGVNTVVMESTGILLDPG